MYKKDFKKLSAPELKRLISALKRSRDAAQNIVDRTEGVITYNGGRKELQQHLRWYEKQLNKAFEVAASQEMSKPAATKKKIRKKYGR